MFIDKSIIMSLKNDYKGLETLSPLEQSQKVQAITKHQTGFGYEKIDDILQDLNDEVEELKSELKLNGRNNNNKIRIFEELGDVLFVMGNLSNKFDIDSNDALLHSIGEFKRRIIYCEEHCSSGDLQRTSNTEMIKLWKEAKRKIK